MRIHKIKYQIQLFNTFTRRYDVAWEGPEEYVVIMMNKRYNRRSSRRAIKITEEVILTAKRGQYVNSENNSSGIHNSESGT